MSLVNNALKRAQLAQRSGPSSSPSNWMMPPVEPTPPAAGRRLPWFTVVGALMLACFCLWQVLRKNRADNQPPAPAIPAPASRVPEATFSAPPPAASLAAQPAPRATPPPNAAGALTAAPIRPIPPSSPPGQTAVAGPSGPATALPSLRLQAIVFDRLHPSAIINGRTLLLGDKFGELCLVALDGKSVTLAGEGKTNVLTLR